MINFKNLLLFEFVKLSNYSLILIYISMLLGVIVSFLDIYLSSILSMDNYKDQLFFILFIFIIRTFISLICNYVILKFTLSVEIDLKIQALQLNEKNRDNYFKLISFNTAHIAFTGILRIMTELIIILILSSYIAVSNSKLFINSFFYFIIVAIIFTFYMILSKNVRQRAAIEQKIYLNKGSDIVSLSDRAIQLGAIDFFSKKISELSKKYSYYTINSLFINQSFKPLFEILILIFAIYLYYNDNLLGPIIYIYYRIANGILIIINNVPLIDHYLKQHKSSFN